MICYDTHVHSDFSTDSDTPMDSQIKKAIGLGLRGICLTDHMDYDFPKDQFVKETDSAPFTFDTASYQAACRSAKETYPAIEIFTGVECGLQSTPSVHEKNKRLCDDKKWDFIIGSLHLVNRKDPYYPAFWEGLSKRGALQLYFDELYQNIQCLPLFDTLGHLDYIVRYAPKPFSYQPKDYFDILDAILRFLIQKDIALEVNTSGFQITGFPNPHIDILKRYHDLGGTAITIGSDAHTTNRLAFSFDRVETLIRQSGFGEYYIFKQRTPFSIPF